MAGAVVALLVMTRRLVIIGFVLAVLWLAAPDAHAQSVELGIFGGYGFGGALLSTVGAREIPIDSGVTYGGTAAIEFVPRWRLEALVMRQESQVRLTAPDVRVDVNVERYMAGIQQEDIAGRVRIFGAFMLGATRFVPAGTEGETWFTIGIGAGVKTFVVRHVGFRFEARGYYSPVTISGRVYCGSSTCLIDYTGSGLIQGDVGAGVFFTF
jgi:hypothetical protein